MLRQDTLGGHVPCVSQRCNKEYLLVKLNFVGELSTSSMNQFGDPDRTLSAQLQDTLRTGLPRALGNFSWWDPSTHSDHCGSRQG